MGETVEVAGQDPEQGAPSYAGVCSYSSNLAIIWLRCRCGLAEKETVGRAMELL